MIKKLYKQLHAKYGEPQGQWKLWRKRPKTLLEREEVIIGAILTQMANWKNVDLAMNRLKDAGICSLYGIYELARFVKKNRLSQDTSYNSLQRLFEKNIKRDYRLYQDFHALIVIDGKLPVNGSRD